MCGIAGVLFSDASRPPDRMVLKVMGDAIAHRGPDAEGFWVEAGVGLVHRRLSIIDLAGGDQPVGNENGSVQVVFNGEIYNFQALRSELEGKGHRFRTHSDTEVLVHLYEELGPELVSRLRGMFAFALWDRLAKKLLLARDRLGIKPLYYHQDGAKLLFASEPKAILAYPGFERSVDPAALEDYLALGMVSGARSIFRGIRQLLPGHTLVVQANRLDAPARRYWQLNLAADETRTVEDWQDAIDAKLTETVKMHMIADVPVGAFLSGGLDSSAVVANATPTAFVRGGEKQTAAPSPCHLVTLSDTAGEGSLRTFSIGFNEQAFSELPYARRVAEQFGTTHHEEIVTADAVELVDELSFFFDEPFADPSAIPTFLVSKLAASKVKVVLSGDGGDEAFGGYSRYAHDLSEAHWRTSLPPWLRRWALGPLGRIWPKADWLPRPLRAKTRLTNLALDAASAYANTLSLCRMPLRRDLMAPDMAGTLNGHDPGAPIRAGFATAATHDPLGGMLAADIAVVLPDDFLVKVDRASMAHGLEVRPPLLDHEFLELAARIPSRWKVRKGESKWIFKEACSRRLPADIVRRPKQGFDMPIDAWLRGPLRPMFESCVLDSQGPIQGLVNQTSARNLYRGHLAGTGKHGKVLWSLLILARWAERYLMQRISHR